MQIPFLSFDKRNDDLRSEVFKVFEEFFNSNWYVLGGYTKEFERAFANYHNIDYCVGISSGLDALHLSLIALGIGKGDEVIVPSNTYIATVLAVSYVGARPVFVEPRIETANINPDLIEEAITPKTKCIIPVHLYGQPCEMDLIMEIANNYNLFVVEDNAQSHGAKYSGQLTGTFGDINATSFYPTKNLGALGESGAITTRNKEFAEKIEMLRNYGSKERYFNEVIGYNNRIDEFEAAFLTLALNKLDDWNEERIKSAKLYNSLLENIPHIDIIEQKQNTSSVFHLYVIKSSKRDRLRAYLENLNIGTQIHYPVPPHLQKAYKQLGYKKGDYPVAESLANDSLSLPLYPGIKIEEIEFIADKLKEFNC